MNKLYTASKSVPFLARRQHFFAELEKGSNASLAIIPAASEQIRNDDVHFAFRQDSNFYYLTGFEEPDAIAVFRNVGGKKEYVLFVLPKDLSKEIWTGYRCGVDAAVSRHQVDRAYPVEEFEAQLAKLLQGVEDVYFSLNRSSHRIDGEGVDQKVLRVMEKYRQSLGRSGRGLVNLRDPFEILGEMRLFKAPEEIERLRIASAITARAHTEAMARVKPGMNESEVEAIVEYGFRAMGARRLGYNSIIAGGKNSTILHYNNNNCTLEDQSLLLIDAGGEFDYYTSDITRTFPVNGKFTPAQRTLYDVVLQVQKECIAMAKPGSTLTSIHQFAVNALTDAMIKLGFLSGERKQLVESQAYRRFYPHNTGHFLGMDVHDRGLNQIHGEPRRLEAGMCFTIEPGFYVQYDDSTVDPKYRGIGIRIEDDILITPDGAEVLTSQVTKEVADLEQLIGSRSAQPLVHW